jgi:hypothetical protein
MVFLIIDEIERILRKKKSEDNTQNLESSIIIEN